MFKLIAISGILFGTLLGCADGSRSFSASSSQSKGAPNFHEAGQATYRYAFSGQVLNEITKTAVKDFSVSLLSEDSGVSAVLNALGDANGMFHISRNPTTQDPLFSSLPVLLSAPGFESTIQMLDMGSDCQSTNCPGTKPVGLALKPVADAVAELSGVNVAELSTTFVRHQMEKRGVPALFKQLLSAGKLDPTVSGLLARAKNKDFIPNVLVLLKGTSAGFTPDAVASLLGSVGGEKVRGLAGMTSSLVPLIANSSPEVGSALLSVNSLLPYLTPIVGAVGDKQAGPLGQVISGLVVGKNAEENLLNLASQMQGNSNNPKLAMASFVPLVQNLVAKKPNASALPFANILTSSLKDPNLLNFIGVLGKKGAAADAGLPLLATYLQPLVQGLVGKNAPEIATLLNQLLQKDGLMAIKEFKSLPDQQKFAKLLPYIEPLIQGLNSKDSTALAGVLIPLVSSGNPALALRELLTKGSGNNETKAKFASLLFPSLQGLLGQTVPGKQLFTAQLLQGLLSGELKDLRVIQDLQGAPALVLSGQAMDLFKIAQLPNVAKVISLAE